MASESIANFGGIYVKVNLLFYPMSIRALRARLTLCTRPVILPNRE
jgi:hypothetical protein